MRRTIRALLMVMLLTVAATMAIPVSASAAVGDLTCTATAQGNFTPPLTAAGGTVDFEVTGAFSNCVSPNGSYSSIKSGTITGEGEATSLPGFPCYLLLSFAGSAKVDWSPGATPDSKLDFRFNANLFAGAVEISAIFTHGPLAGDSFTPVAGEINPNVDCLLSGELEYIATSLFVVAIG